MDTTGGNGLLYIKVDKGICSKCQYLTGQGYTCKAFPGGIPTDILTGKIQHTKLIEGDNGIFFKPYPGEREIIQFPKLSNTKPGKTVSLN